MALAEIDINTAIRQGWRPGRGGWRCGDCDKKRDIEIVNDTLDRLRADRLAREETLAVQELAVVMRQARDACGIVARGSSLGRTRWNLSSVTSTKRWCKDRAGAPALRRMRLGACQEDR